ncbi:MAG: orotidine 5'-phosphate decarboxylase, partial [Gemmatimonadetes bacterium]|nr:orotidine 5'-phosphate decarboxylase [Gemmatimonadota bacterium]
MNFSEKLEQTVSRNNSLVCVGLDSDPTKLPPHLQGDVLAFNRQIIDATADLVCAYKPNFAFFGALGEAGWSILKGTLECVPDDIP